jgi:hypothetical protein
LVGQLAGGSATPDIARQANALDAQLRLSPIIQSVLILIILVLTLVKP